MYVYCMYIYCILYVCMFYSCKLLTKQQNIFIVAGVAAAEDQAMFCYQLMKFVSKVSDVIRNLSDALSPKQKVDRNC